MTTFMSAFESTLRDIAGKWSAANVGGLLPEDIVSKCRNGDTIEAIDDLSINACWLAGRAVRDEAHETMSVAEKYENAGAHVGKLVGRYFDLGRLAESGRCAAYVVFAKMKARGERTPNRIIEEMRGAVVS